MMIVVKMLVNLSILARNWTIWKHNKFVTNSIHFNLMAQICHRMTRLA